MRIKNLPWLALAAALAFGLCCAGCAKKSPVAQQPAPAQSASSGDSEPEPQDDPFPIADEEGIAKSKALNSQGFDAYKKGDYVEAAKLFDHAVDANRRNDTAWYNEACSMSLALSKDGAAATVTDIVECLGKSLTLNSARAAKLGTDPDLASLQGEEPFMALVERFNGQKDPALVTLQGVDSFEGDFSVTFKAEDKVADLVFHGGDLPMEQLVDLGILIKDGDRYAPGEAKAGAPFYARYKEVSGPPASSQAGADAAVTTHLVLISLEVATGLDAGA
jgi:hypothetical protein